MRDDLILERDGKNYSIEDAVDHCTDTFEGFQNLLGRIIKEISGGNTPTSYNPKILGNIFPEYTFIPRDKR